MRYITIWKFPAACTLLCHRNILKLCDMIVMTRLLQFDRRRGKKLLHLSKTIITLVGIINVYYTCGKLGITFVGKFFITFVGNFITLVGTITVVGNFITLVGVITSRKFYYTCGSGNNTFLLTEYFFCLREIDSHHTTWSQGNKYHNIAKLCRTCVSFL